MHIEKGNKRGVENCSGTKEGMEKWDTVEREAGFY